MKIIILSYIFLLSSLFSSAQLILIDYTESLIKNKNKTEHNFEFKWKNSYHDGFWFLSTANPNTKDLMTFYVFENGKTTNHEVIQVTNKGWVAGVIEDAIFKMYSKIDDNLFFQKETGIVVRRSYDIDKGYMFRYYLYNP
jgi:hypothetical protein